MLSTLPFRMNPASSYNKLDGVLAALGGWLDPVLLLVIRGRWSYH